MEVLKKGNVFIIKVAGVLNVVNSNQLELELDQFLMEFDPKKIAIDMTNVEYISSSGIRVIISLHKKLLNSGRKMVIFGMQPHVEKVFKLIELDSVLSCFNNLDEAIDSLK